MRVEHLAEGVVIYALCQPVDKWRTGPVRYVGKTVQTPWNRVRAHITSARNHPKLPVHWWLRKHAHEPYHIRHLERVPPGADWAARERYWIAKFRAEGCDLLNMTDGGEGFAGLQRTDEHRRKIGEALRTGAEFLCEQCGSAFWRKRSDIAKGNNRFCCRECYQASLRGVSRPVSSIATERGIAAAAAKRKAQTHCKRGHEFTASNTHITRAGSRACRECMKLHKRNYRAARHG